MAKLEKETGRELEFIGGGATGLYYFVCKEKFPDFLEGAHSAADHLFVNFPHVCQIPRVDYEVVFDDGKFSWTTSLHLAVRFALLNKDQSSGVEERDKRIAELESIAEAWRRGKEATDSIVDKLLNPSRIEPDSPPQF